MNFYFWHNFSPASVIIDFGFWQLRWYGLIIAIALVAGFLVFKKLATRRGVAEEKIYDFVFWLVVAGVVGARLYAVGLFWSYYANHLSEIFKIWEGGLAIHGAILAGALATIIWSKKNKINFFKLVDLTVPALALGQAVGRWGNYFNQELFGRPTEKSWGIFIAPENRPAAYINSTYFQPTFFYESVLNLVLFTVLFFTVKKSQRQGLTTGIYLCGYALIRFGMEFLRIDETPILWGLRFPQWASLIALICGIVLIFMVIRRK